MNLPAPGVRTKAYQTVIRIEVPVDRESDLVDRIADYAMDEATKLGMDAFGSSVTSVQDAADVEHQHEWSPRGAEDDHWRECWLCGTQEDRP